MHEMSLAIGVPSGAMGVHQFTELWKLIANAEAAGTSKAALREQGFGSVGRDRERSIR